MTVLSMKDSFNLWQNGCISPLLEQVEEISTAILLLKRMGTSRFIDVLGLCYVGQTHQTFKLRKGE